jgi:hypothetical protein
LFQVSADADKPGSVSARLGVIAHRSEWPDSTQSKFKTQVEVMFSGGEKKDLVEGQPALSSSLKLYYAVT